MLTDVVVYLDRTGTIETVEWRNRDLKKEWDMHPKNLDNRVFSAALKEPFGELEWNHDHFFYERLPLEAGRSVLLLKRNDHELEMLRLALNYLDDGFQLYDQNARLMFINSASRKIADFPENTYPVVGTHLLNLYPKRVDDNNSTVLTTLRTGQPVINRFAGFQSMTGKTLFTVNTGYPLHASDGHLLGSAVFEQDINVLRKKKDRLEKISVAMEQQIATGLYSRKVSKGSYTFDDYIGKSVKVREAVDLARSVADKKCNVLLLGETGTGKEIFAQSIHHESLRWQKKFVAINCAAVPEQLVESILFGTVKGSFTGSVEKAGLFEEADGGTVFLDELNSMGLSMQSKLLRVLQENTFRRVGGNRDIHANVRIIASCNENVFQLIQENKLRRDLFYRIATIMIDLPPLRDHLEDIEALIWHRIRQNSAQYALNFTRIDEKVIWLLQQYSWPGNVRELNHVIDYALTIGDDEVLLPEHLPKYILEAVQGPTDTAKGAAAEGHAVPLTVSKVNASLQEMLEAYEEQVVRQALRQTEGNISQAADLLEIRRQSLQYRLRKYRKNET